MTLRMVQDTPGAAAQARTELALFAVGLLIGTFFTVISLVLLPMRLTGYLAFLWVASWVNYAVVGALAADHVLQQKRADAPRFLPVTGCVLGFVLPVILVMLWYSF